MARKKKSDGEVRPSHYLGNDALMLDDGMFDIQAIKMFPWVVYSISQPDESTSIVTLVQFGSQKAVEGRVCALTFEITNNRSKAVMSLARATQGQVLSGEQLCKVIKAALSVLTVSYDTPNVIRSNVGYFKLTNPA